MTALAFTLCLALTTAAPGALTAGQERSPARAGEPEAGTLEPESDAPRAADSPAPVAGDAGQGAAPAATPSPAGSSRSEREEAAAAAADALALEAALAPTPDEREGSKLDLYGFADFMYMQPLVGPNNPWRQMLNPYPSFAVGNINLYIDANITERLRSLVEVRFLYVPHGSRVVAADGSYAEQDNSVFDPAEMGRLIRWGGLGIERAFIEYVAHERLTIRAGQWLTPYGIWNVDHGSPTIIGIKRPYIVREQLFPERQTGIELYGSRPLGTATLRYHLTLSNGRGLVDEYADADDNKGLGGRVALTLHGRGELVLGLSAYKGRYTDRQARWVPDGNVLRQQTLVRQQYDELALAADVRFDRGGWHAQTELIVNDRAHTEAARMAATGSTTQFLPDVRRWGAYLLFGHRFRPFGLMPYVNAEIYRISGPTAITVFAGPTPTVMVFYAGINARPDPRLVLKLELAKGYFPDSPPGSWGAEGLTLLQAQAAWAF